MTAHSTSRVTHHEQSVSSEPPSEPPKAARLPAVRMYAGVLDDKMCPECAGHAGREYRHDDPEAPTIPNQRCGSPHGCRCTWL